jgi:anti-anti-sigma factor
LSVRGDCDLTSVRRLREALAAFDGLPVEVDLGGVTFFDSTALQVLVDAHGRNPALRVGQMSQDVSVVLKITGTYRLLRGTRGALDSTPPTPAPA